MTRNPQDIPEITTPARAFELRNSQYDWAYQTVFVDKPDYERLEKPNTRGKVLGGSSSLNYYTWIPGSKATFDEWADYGGDTWNWDGCKQYLAKVIYPWYAFTPAAPSLISSLLACEIPRR